MKKKTIYYIIIAFVAVLTSCSKTDYRDVVPANSIAILEVKHGDIFSQSSLQGMDTTQSAILFETVDGLLGMTTRIDDAELFAESFIADTKAMSSSIDVDGINCCLMNESWVVGSNGDVAVVLGPVTGQEAFKKTARRISTMFGQSEDTSIRSSEIWKHLQEVPGTSRMVAQANALPEQLIAPMMIGAPKGTDATDVLIEASMTFDRQSNTIQLVGGACSYMQNVRQSMQNVENCYRQLTFDWKSMLADSVFIGVFMNVKGADFLPYVQQSKALNTMLLNSNAYDELRDNDGNMAILLTPKSKTVEDGVKCSVLRIKEISQQPSGRFAVVLNLNALGGPVTQALSSVLGDTKRIIYMVK